MNYQINPQLSPYQQPLTGISSSPLPAVDNEKIKQDLNNSAVIKKANSVVDKPGVVVGLTAAIWVGLSQAMAKFNKACRGEYNNSVIGRIDNKVAEIPFFKSKKFENLTEKLVKRKNKFRANVIDRKNGILSSMFNTPSSPENHMAQMMSKGTLGEVASDATQLFNKYTNDGKDLDKLIQLGFTKEVTKDGKTVIEANLEHFQDVMKRPHTKESIDKIMEACKKVNPDEVRDVTKIGSNTNIKFIKKLLGREVAFSEVANKLEALGGKLQGEALPVGKLVSKSTMRTLEGLTNGTAGGKFAILMQAYFLADAIKKAYNAPKGDKFQTFTEEFTNGLAMYLTMPLAVNLMHKAGGLQYIGMKKGEVTKELAEGKVTFDEAIKVAKQSKKVEDYRVALKLFNEKAEKGLFTNRAEHIEAKKLLKGLLQGELAELKGFAKVKKFLYKPFKMLGKVVTVGLETTRGFIKPGTIKSVGGAAKNASKFKQFFSNPLFMLKKGAGYPMRFGVYLFLIAPFLSKLAVRASHVVFGRPAKSLLDEEKPEENKSATPAVQPIQQQNAVTAVPNKSVVDLYNQNTQPKTNNENSNNQAAPSKPARTYVPSSAGVQVQASAASAESIDKVSLALNKADKTEQATMKFIAGH